MTYKKFILKLLLNTPSSTLACFLSDDSLDFRATGGNPKLAEFLSVMIVIQSTRAQVPYKKHHNVSKLFTIRRAAVLSDLRWVGQKHIVQHIRYLTI